MVLDGLMLSYASRLLLNDPLARTLHAPTRQLLEQAVPVMSTPRKIGAIFELIRGEAFRALAERPQLIALEVWLDQALNPMEKLELRDAQRDAFFRQVA